MLVTRLRKDIVPALQNKYWLLQRNKDLLIRLMVLTRLCVDTHIYFMSSSEIIMLLLSTLSSIMLSWVVTSTQTLKLGNHSKKIAEMSN